MSSSWVTSPPDVRSLSSRSTSAASSSEVVKSLLDPISVTVSSPVAARESAMSLTSSPAVSALFWTSATAVLRISLVENAPAPATAMPVLLMATPTAAPTETEWIEARSSADNVIRPLATTLFACLIPASTVFRISFLASDTAMANESPNSSASETATAAPMLTAEIRDVSLAVSTMSCAEMPVAPLPSIAACTQVAIWLPASDPAPLSAKPAPLPE